MNTIAVPVPRRLAELPRDRRSFVVPAEAAWTVEGPVIDELGQAQNFALGFTRSCAVCGYRLAPDATVWRLFNQVEASARRRQRRNLLEVANPGHLLCMLYSSQICPFWSRPEARLGTDSLLAPGARRGALVALLGFDNYQLLLPLGSNVQSARFLYLNLIEDIPFRSPVELTPRYTQALAAEEAPVGERAYWSNSEVDLRRLERVLRKGEKVTLRRGPEREVESPAGDVFGAFSLPLI